MKRMSLLNPVIITTLLLIACGGGGGDGEEATATDPSTTFDLTEFKSLDEGVKYTYTLAGSDSNGDIWSGSISSTIGAIVNIEGVDYIPEEILVSLTYEPTNETKSDLENHYYNLSAEPVYFTLQSEGIRCDADTVHLLPDSVLIGQSGAVTSYTCNNDSIFNGTWSVENANDGFAYLVIDRTIWNVLTGSITASEIDTFKMDSSGNITSLSIISYNADVDLTVYLSTF